MVVMISSLVLLISNTGPWYLKGETKYLDDAQTVNFLFYYQRDSSPKKENSVINWEG